VLPSSYFPFFHNFIYFSSRHVLEIDNDARLGLGSGKLINLISVDAGKTFLSKFHIVFKLRQTGKCG
jgi:hypothetical protein